MPPPVHAYTVPKDWPAEAWSETVDRVRGSLAADPPATRVLTVSLRDTANRRLTRQGWLLTCTAGEDDRESWTLADPDGGTVASDRIAPPSPSFAGDLPDGALRSALDDLSRGGFLHPVAAFSVQEITTVLRDDQGKIRCRLRLTRAAESDRAEADLCVLALKGYEADAQRVADHIELDLGWQPAPRPALARLVSRTAPVPGRPGADLRADDPAGPVMREILSAELDVLEDRLPGVIADRHPDYLHQFRVAVRRTRSALSQLSHAIALEGRAEAVEGFRWLGQVTSPQRDLDVQLQDLADRRAQTPGDPSALAPLERHLQRLKTASHRDLVLTLSGARFQTLIARWRDSLSPSSANWTATEPLRAPFAETVSARGATLLRKVLRDGRRIGPDSEAERLHDLRKRMKKLRYVAEFLAEVLPREKTKPAIKALKGLQEVLGRVQDREVQVEALHGYGRDLAGRKGVSAETLMAIGAWSEELDRDRREARAEFADAFRTFSAPDTQALFATLFDGHTGPDAFGGGKSHKRARKEG